MLNLGEPVDADGEGTESSLAEKRDQAAARRDQAADRRDEVGEQRDEAGEQRDHAGEGRDEAGARRDEAGEQRDQAGEQRDQDAEQREAATRAESTADAVDRAALARREAASDRREAAQDRQAGAAERTRAELDRDSAVADRGSGASERTQSELDRNVALADRSASAKEREDAAIDGLTGASLRGPGFVELRHDVARARRTQQPLTLAFVDVDRLKAINDTHGHAAGDRMLLEVASALRARLRPYDLIIRYGGDEFVCAISGLNMADAAMRLGLVNVALAAGPEHGSVTLGLAELQPDDSIEDLVERADAALYRERERRRR